MVRASDLKAGVWSLKAFSSPRINYLRISKKTRFHFFHFELQLRNRLLGLFCLDKWKGIDPHQTKNNQGSLPKRREPFFCRKVRFFNFCSFFEKFRFRRRSDHDRRRIFFGRKNESPGTGSDFSSRIHSAPKSIGWAEYERSMKAVVFYRRRWRRSYRVVGLFPSLL